MSLGRLCYKLGEARQVGWELANFLHEHTAYERALDAHVPVFIDWERELFPVHTRASTCHGYSMARHKAIFNGNSLDMHILVSPLACRQNKHETSTRSEVRTYLSRFKANAVAASLFFQEAGDYAGARDAFSRARAVFVDRFGKNDARARSAMAAALGAGQHIALLASKGDRALAVGTSFG